MKTEKKKTLRGSVLFTVVCVMALLIIFLTGTLALASAAGNRAHRSYSISQASYTARTAIEGFTQAMKRDKGIEAAVEEMGSGSGKIKEMYPKVVIPDKTLGAIGYIDEHGDWVADRIKVEQLDNSEAYNFFPADNTGVSKWNKVEGVKVTATCKVGREYETVAAYIQKTASSGSKISPGGINGFQEVGGNHFPNGALITGGLGVGIGNSAAEVYHIHNKQLIDTSLMFVNSNVVFGASDTHIYVHKPLDEDNAAKPYSQTVIKGNLLLEHGNDFIINEYDMTQNYTQAEIPYLFVEGVIAPTDDANYGLVTGNNSPFNVFAGTLYANATMTINADLYLMDKNDGTTIEAPYADRDGAAQKTMTYNKGQNFFGNKSGNKLYEWSTSVVQRTETQHNSTGGNIYCMGDLTLQKAEIHGDVRVQGNCTIKDEVTIYGDLVVAGHLQFDNNNLNKIVKGQIYNSDHSGDESKTEVMKPGYSYHDNELFPGVEEVPSRIFENNPIEVTEVSDTKMNHDPWHNEITYPDGTVEDLVWDHKTIYVQNGTENWWDAAPYYRITENGTEDQNTIVFDQYSKYAVDPDGHIMYLKDEDGNNVIGANGDPIAITVDSDFTYFKKNGTEYERIDEKDAKGSYYTDPSGNVVGEGEAKNKVGAADIHDYSEYVKDHGSAYPTSMEKDKIWGKYTAAGFEPSTEGKIVKTLQEVRKDLNLNDDGTFDGQYYMDVPDKYLTVPGDNTSLPNAFSGNSLNPDVAPSGYIEKSCIIGDESDYTKSYKLPIDKINIKASSEIWIVLKNVNMYNSKELIVDATSAKVNFLIDGDCRIDLHSLIRPSNYVNGMQVKYTDVWPIEYYATEGATLTFNDNSTCVGTFKAPTLTLDTSTAGEYEVTYLDEYGNVHPDPKKKEEVPMKPVIVGSCLADGMSQAKNSFSLINTNGGGKVGGGTSFKGTFGWYDVSYFMGV